MTWPDTLDPWRPPLAGMQWRHGDDWQEVAHPMDFELPAMHSPGDVITVEEEPGGEWRVYRWDGEELRLEAT
jgi:hypothetical protein